MGEWKRCSKCGGRVNVYAVIAKTGKTAGHTDEDREARQCKNKKCSFLEVVPVKNESPVISGKKR